MTASQITHVPTATSLTPYAEPNKNVPQSCNRALLQNRGTFSPSGGGLVSETITGLRLFFATSTNHSPSPGMWKALHAVAQVLSDMAEGACSKVIHLSSLDPGVGKTQTIIHFVRALLRSTKHDRVGVMICVARLEEIQVLVRAMQLEDDDFAVLTADRTLNSLGGVPVTFARVLFTTQQMVEKRCGGNAFELTSEFHYGGRPRQVRIWDECILPGQTITLNRDDLGFLFKPLRATYPELTSRLDALFNDLATIVSGSTYHVDDFAHECGVTINDVLRLVSDYPEYSQRAASTLWLLSGKKVSVRRENRSGNTLISFQETLPADLAPLLVLDASGRVRTTYQEWQRGRGGIEMLPSATKSYRKLTVHLWRRGGGKGSFARNDHLVDGIATTINLKPLEEWLVICHKPKDAHYDIEADIKSLVRGDPGRVHFITWGNHQATNRYSHISNVILAGTLFYPLSHYESLGRLASGHSAENGMYPEKAMEAIIIGEHKHLILQAACRGSVRQCEGDECLPCNVYIIASNRHGIDRALPSIFPGCKVVPWKPLPAALRGKVAETMAFIDSWLASNTDLLLPFKTVYRAMGQSSRMFAKHMRDNPSFQEALAERGLVEYGEGPYKTSFLRVDAAGHILGFMDETASA